MLRWAAVAAAAGPTALWTQCGPGFVDVDLRGEAEPVLELTVDKPLAAGGARVFFRARAPADPQRWDVEARVRSEVNNSL